MFLQSKLRQLSVLHLKVDTLDILGNGCSYTALLLVASSALQLFPSPREVIAQPVPYPASFCQTAWNSNKDPDT